MRPARRRLSMPMRLLPRGGERPAGADIGLLEVWARLLAIFLAGDLGFRMERGRVMATLRGLHEERPSLPDNVGTEVDLVRRKAGGLKKSLPRPSELILARLERSRAGSTFSKSLALKKSATLRLPGEVTMGMADEARLASRRPRKVPQLGATRPALDQGEEVSMGKVGMRQGWNLQFCMFLAPFKLCSRVPSRGANGWRTIVAIVSRSRSGSAGEGRCRTNKQTAASATDRLGFACVCDANRQRDGPCEQQEIQANVFPIGFGGRAVRVLHCAGVLDLGSLRLKEKGGVIQGGPTPSVLWSLLLTKDCREQVERDI